MTAFDRRLRSLRGPIAIVGLGCLLSACASRDVRGLYFDITATGTDNQCTPAASNLNETFEYRLMIDGNDIELAVGENIFAWGTIAGSNIVYESAVWNEERDGNEISWQIRGSAFVDTSAAGQKQGAGWDGGETFVIVNSADPELAPGCQYITALTGTFLEEIK